MPHIYPLYRSLRLVCRVGLGVLTHLRGRGSANVPARGPTILAANHQSYLDPVLVGCCTDRILNFMARDTLFQHRAFALLIRSLNAFPVKRGRADVASFKQSMRLLKAGEALLVFPEATRTETGRIRRLQPGVMSLARRTSATVVPVAVEGAFEVWPRDAYRPRLGRTWVEFGTPLLPDEIEPLSDAEAAALLTARLRALHNALRKRVGRAPFDYTDEAAAGAESADVGGAVPKEAGGASHG